MPRLATQVLQANSLFVPTAVQSFPLHDAVDVFIGANGGKGGKGHPHAVAPDRHGRRLDNSALPNDEAPLRVLINELKAHGPLLCIVD